MNQAYLSRDILAMLDERTYYILRDSFQRATNLNRLPKEIDVEGEMYVFRKLSSRANACYCMPGDTMYENQAGKVLKILR